MRYAKSIWVMIILLGFSASTAIAQFQYPKFEWDKTTHNFGDVKHNATVEYEFEFTNKGQAPLVISEVKPSCGCTITEYTKDPVMPGKKGKVKATFDSASMGKFHKSIKITANVEGGPEFLYIQGTVIN